MKKDKPATAILLSIAAILCGFVLNFPEFLMGNPANIKNLLVTVLYVASWILVMLFGANLKNRGILKYCSVFWGATSFASAFLIYVSATGASVDWTIPFVIPLLPQWYGINYFAGSFVTASIIMTIASLIIFTTAVFAYKRAK